METLNTFMGQGGFFFCTGGEAELMVNNEIYRMRRGVLCIVSPINLIYKVSQSEDFTCVEMLDELSVFYPVVRSILDVIFKLKPRNKPCLQLNETEMTFLTERKRIIEEKRQMQAEATTAEEKTLLERMIQALEQETLMEVIHIYFRNRLVDAETIEKTEMFVYHFLYSLNQHFKTERSVAFYADEAHLSTGYFTSVIKQKTGRTPSEWISTITIVQAKLLLEKTNKSIKEIASELNFPEQFTFRKYFKQHTGVAPKEYRLLNGTCKP